MNKQLIEQQGLPKVLVVDDDPENLAVLEKMLADIELKLFKARSGQEAVMLARSNEFALIILDVEMPGINGFKTAELVRYFGNSRRSPIIFLTAAAIRDENIFQGYKAGAVDYLFKPVSAHILQSKVVIFIELFQQKAVIDLQRINLEKSLEAQTTISEELETAQKNADQANRAKTQFLANMSHEIRTPLSAIIGFNQILVKQSKNLKLPEEFQNFLDHIQTSAQILLELINNILDLSKIETGKMEISEEDFYLSDVVSTLFDTFEFQAKQKGVFLTHETSPKLPPAICADRKKILQILTNLIGNAIKFTPAGKEVKLKLMGDEKNLALMVIDQGIGLSKEQLPIIFDAFTQADRSTASKYGGTGLGLAISKSLAELLGGKLSAGSQGLGLGAYFNVVLPYKTAAHTIEHQETTPQAPFRFSPDRLVLIVEDNKMNQTLIDVMLKNLGFQIKFADNGAIGIEKALKLHAAGHPPDLILMDIQMPVMDGKEASRKIREHPDLRDIPIVALSADAYSEQQEEALASGIDAYLTKPVQIDQLLPLLEKHLSEGTQQKSRAVFPKKNHHRDQ
ncbi:MAG: response regulator [SAR324 cluster bacterium]|nr:response regulator [SAR324 cluster bacterium]